MFRAAWRLPHEDHPLWFLSHLSVNASHHRERFFCAAAIHRRGLLLLHLWGKALLLPSLLLLLLMLLDLVGVLTAHNLHRHGLVGLLLLGGRRDLVGP